jgi:hypothetical protein
MIANCLGEPVGPVAQPDPRNRRVSPQASTSLHRGRPTHLCRGADHRYVLTVIAAWQSDRAGGYWPRSQCPGGTSSRAGAGPHDPGGVGVDPGRPGQQRLSHVPDRSQPVRTGKQRAVAEEGVVDEPDVGRSGSAPRRPGQRDRRPGDAEVQRRAGLLGHQGQVDLAVASERERQHVPGAGQPAGQRPGQIAEDQADSFTYTTRAPWESRAGPEPSSVRQMRRAGRSGSR